MLLVGFSQFTLTPAKLHANQLTGFVCVERPPGRDDSSAGNKDVTNNLADFFRLDRFR